MGHGPWPMGDHHSTADGHSDRTVPALRADPPRTTTQCLPHTAGTPLSPLPSPHRLEQSEFRAVAAVRARRRQSPEGTESSGEGRKAGRDCEGGGRRRSREHLCPWP